jgi:ABC-2 type transport system ATP-binding protein
VTSTGTGLVPVQLGAVRPSQAHRLRRPRLRLDAVSRSFDGVQALADVDLSLEGGRVHALLGPNGAGKTTLLRICAGLTAPTRGTVERDGSRQDGPLSRAERHRVGLVPAGDRTFYLRLSGQENLLFFARLHGLPRRTAVLRCRELLDLVGLSDAGDRPAGKYSHGMQKRLSVARALLVDPPLLLVDEATHDLDPSGARAVRDLVRAAADAGAAVLWTTQHLDELRGFADVLTVLRGGRVRFAGTVAQLAGHATSRQYRLLLEDQHGRAPHELLPLLQAALAGLAELEPDPTSGPSHHLLRLHSSAPLGTALQRLIAVGVLLHGCHLEASQLEDAFLRLTAVEGPA